MEIISFFKSSNGFDRVLRAMHDVYLHHGRAFGAVRLTRPSIEEENALSDFFKRDYYDQALIRIGLADFERQIQKNFNNPNAALSDILEEYAGKPKSPRLAIKKTSTFASAVLNEACKFEGTTAEIWLKEISTQTRRIYRSLSERYHEDSNTINMIRTVAKALNNTNKSEELIPLAEFSKKHTDSHTALDFHETLGSLFLKALACKFKLPLPNTLDECINLHFRAGLLSCGMLSSVTVNGLFDTCRTLTLENLADIKTFSAHNKKAFVLEDPQVFAAVSAMLNSLKCTIICPTGGHNAAFMYLIKKLHAENISIYYAGNMNFKGLEPADKLYLEFGKGFIPWRYSREDYAQALSQGGIPLPDDKKNLAMHNSTLASMLSLLRKTGKTASSIPLIPFYAEDIKISVQ
jgi:uncharacterized protein (TIGR02679 family)